MILKRFFILSNIDDNANTNIVSTKVTNIAIIIIRIPLSVNITTYVTSLKIMPKHFDNNSSDNYSDKLRKDSSNGQLTSGKKVNVSCLPAC